MNTVSAMIDIDKERSLFESEVLRLDIIDEEGLGRDAAGDYIDEPAQAGWKAWQARAAIPAPAAAEGQAEALTYVIMVRSGMAPVVKGPLPDKKCVEDMLRDLYKLHADAQCMVIDMPNTSWPQSGIEWIDMYGDKRRTPIREVLVAVPRQAAVASPALSEKHECVIRLAAKAVVNRGHEGDAKLADSLIGVLAHLKSAAPSSATSPGSAYVPIGLRGAKQKVNIYDAGQTRDRPKLKRADGEA